MENFKNIWTEVEPTVSLCDSLYQAVSSPLENLDAKKLYNLRTFFLEVYLNKLVSKIIWIKRVIRNV